MVAAELPPYHVQAFAEGNRYRPRGFSAEAQAVDSATASARSHLLLTPGNTLCDEQSVDDYVPTPPQSVFKKKVRFRHGVAPRHFPIVETDDLE